MAKTTKSQARTNDNGKRNLHDRIFECVDQCLPDLFICKNLLIVL